MTRYVNDLQKYKKLIAKDRHAVEAYEVPMLEEYDIIMYLKEKAEKEGIANALYYGMNAAYKVGFIRGIRYEKSRVKRSTASKTGAKPAGSEQIRPTDQGEVKQYFILIHDYEGCIIAEDAYISTRPEAEAEAARRVDQLGGRSYTIAEPVHPVYTSEQWAEHKEFSAYPGQQISREIYQKMLNVLPPVDLPEGAADQIRERYGVQITDGFLVSEPYGNNNAGLTYSCFARSGETYFYFGEMNK